MAVKDLIPLNDSDMPPITAIGTTYGANVFGTREFGEFATFAKAVLILNVSAFSGTGTPTLDVTMEEYDPQSDTWGVLPSPLQFTQVTATGRQRIVITDFGILLRPRYVTGGATISVTFTLTAIAIDR